MLKQGLLSEKRTLCFLQHVYNTCFYFQINILEILAVVVISVIMTLIFDTPMQNAKNVIMAIEISFRKKKTEEDKDGNPEAIIEEQQDVNACTEEQISEEQTEEEMSTGIEAHLEMPAEDEFDRYNEDDLDEEDEGLHHDLDKDIIYEEEEDEDMDIMDLEAERDRFAGDVKVKEGDGNSHEGENQIDDEDLEDWEWTSGANSLYRR